MTKDELKRLEQGKELLSDISAYRNKISGLESDDFKQSAKGYLRYVIDDDLIDLIIAKQIARNTTKIIELQKQFDEL